MERSTPPHEQLSLGLGAEDAPIAETVLLLHRELKFVAEMVNQILDNLPQQRRPLTDQCKALHVRATWARRNGLCPCCHETPVCLAEEKLTGGEFDHYFGRHRNRPEETWLVCSACNRRLEDTSFKVTTRSAFEAYQHALRPFLKGSQPGLFDERAA